MTCKLNPETLLWAVHRAVGRAVRESAEGAVNVYLAVALDVNVNVLDALDRVVFVAVAVAVSVGPPHPNLDQLLAEVRQTKVGAP